MKKKDEGFTLIELLIVIVILGILATVVVFAVSGIRDKGDAAACQTEHRTILTGLEAYYAEEGSYPGTLALVETNYMQTALKYWPNTTVVAADGSFTNPGNLPDGCVDAGGGEGE